MFSLIIEVNKITAIILVANTIDGYGYRIWKKQNSDVGLGFDKAEWWAFVKTVMNFGFH
jgi:hypothetical protein